VLGTVAWSIAISLWAVTDSFPFSALVCADSVLLVGGSLCGVVGAAGVNSLYTWLGIVEGMTNSSGLADGAPGVDTGSSAINLFTCEVFLEYWVPPGASTMTLLPVLLTTRYGVGLNGVENLSFLSCLTST